MGPCDISGMRIAHLSLSLAMLISACGTARPQPSPPRFPSAPAMPPVMVPSIDESSGGTRRVLLPVNFTKTNRGRGQVNVNSILGAQFADVPALKSPDQVTLREEDRITAYYAGGTLYAEPSRLGPLV